MTLLQRPSLSSQEHLVLDKRCYSYELLDTQNEATMIYPALQVSNGPRDAIYTDAVYPGKENWCQHDLPTKQKSLTTAELTGSDVEVEHATEVASKPEDDSELKSSSSVSNWCAQMVCYIWFGGAAAVSERATSPPSYPFRPSSAQASPVTRRHSKKLSLGSLSESVTFSVRDLHNAVEAHARSSVNAGQSRLSAQERSTDPRALRLYPRRRFTDFVRNMLDTTQVSKSVIILALLYIHRLKSKNPGLRGQDGSEFRLFVTALMLANKFLDDHTYTNKTWSELSGLKLKDVTKMEIEFWLGLSSNIYVSDLDFRSWIGTLESLAEHRQSALSRREQDKRQHALREQQQHQHSQQIYLLQQQQLQQQQHLSAMYDAPRRIAHNSRTSQRSWSPDSFGQRSSPDFVAAHPYASSAISHSRGSHDGDAQSAASDGSMPLSGYTFPSASMQEYTAGSKRSLSHASPISDRHCHESLSTDRAYKRRNVGSERGSRVGTPAARSHGLSPPFGQPCPRSVFEPLVSTPNTLLAPYAMQPPLMGHQQKQYPLAYWQLAAGHDRGILGVHLPAPIACHQDYFEHIPPQHDVSRAYQQYERLSRKPLATTTPYPTPPMDAFPGVQHYTNNYAMANNQHCHHHNGYVSHAPHAPFNNAESHYIDPLSIRY